MPLSKHELAELIEELSKIRGRHTELVTVLIPAGQNINVVADQIEAEKSTADNIKSKATRKNVMAALEMISRELKFYKKTHDNGIAIFCGNVSEKEGQEDIKLWIVEPPQELKVRLYRCDKEFVLEPLKAMLEAEEVYALVALDTKEATFALLEGKQVKILRKITSGIQGKHHAGGQCLNPETTLIKLNNKNKKLKDVKIGDEIKAYDVKNNKIMLTKVINVWKNIKNNYRQIIIKNEMFIEASDEHLIFKKENNKLLEIEAKNLKVGDSLSVFNEKEVISSEILKINIISNKIEMVDIETECKNFIANCIIVHNSSQRFERLRDGMVKEFYRRIADNMKELYFALAKLKGIIIGGPMPTKEDFVKDGQLITALKDKIIGMKDLGYADEHGIEMLVNDSKDILEQQEIMKEKKILENFFEKLGKGEKAAYKKADIEKAIKYGAVHLLILSEKLKKDEIKEWEKKAETISANVEIVSTETPEGEQFFNLGGIGAILRFEV